MPRKAKSRKTYSMAIELDGKVYYVSRIEWRREMEEGFSSYSFFGNSAPKYKYTHTFYLTSKTSSAKKWKTKKGILQSMIDYIHKNRYEVKLGRDIIHKHGDGIWNQVIDEYVDTFSKEKRQYIDNIENECFIMDNARKLQDLIEKMKDIKSLKRKKPLDNSFRVIDSSHNFRKIKLKELMEKTGELDG